MKTVLYFYDNSFAMVRRRLAGILSAARDRRWHVEPIDVTGRIQMLGKLLRFWCPDGIRCVRQDTDGLVRCRPVTSAQAAFRDSPRFA